jgi:hypothetical protein
MTSMKYPNIYWFVTGVIGGVVGLVALAILAFFLGKRAGRGSAANATSGPNPFTHNPDMADHNYAQPGSYNSADPLTFPPFVPGRNSSYSGGYTTSPYQPGRYGGAAEF